MADILPFGAKPGTALSMPVDIESGKKALMIGGIAIGGVALYNILKGQSLFGPKKLVVTTPQVKLTVGVTPASARPGDKITVKVKTEVTGVVENAQVLISFKPDTDEQTDGWAIDKTSEQGTIFTIPSSLVPGTYPISVQVLSNNTSIAKATANIIVLSARQPISGGGGEGGVPAAPSGLTPDFQMSEWHDPLVVGWINPPGTKWVKFELQPVGVEGADVANGYAVILGPTSVYNIRMPQVGRGDYILTPDTQIIWYVSAANTDAKPNVDSTVWGPPGRGSFVTPSANSSTIYSVKPNNNSSNIPTDGKVQWGDKNQYIFMYDIQIASNPEFSGGIISETRHAGKSSPLYSYEYKGLTSGTKFYWRVRPHSTQEVGWSNTWSFTTSGVPVTPPPTTPTPTTLMPTTPTTQVSGVISAQLSDNRVSYSVSLITGNPQRVEIWYNDYNDGNIPSSGWSRVSQDSRNGSFTPNSSFQGKRIVVIAQLVKDNQVVATGNPNQNGYSNNLIAVTDVLPIVSTTIPTTPNIPTTPIALTNPQASSDTTGVRYDDPNTWPSWIRRNYVAVVGSSEYNYLSNLQDIQRYTTSSINASVWQSTNIQDILVDQNGKYLLQGNGETTSDQVISKDQAIARGVVATASQLEDINIYV